MATVKIGSSTGVNAPLNSKVIAGSGSMPDAFSMMYGMSMDDAYNKLMEGATMQMDLGGNGIDTGSIEDSLNTINSIIDQHNSSQAELISGSDFFKSQMAIAERQGATKRTPAAAALGGGTMSTEDLSSKTSAIKSPIGVQQAAKSKAQAGGK